METIERAEGETSFRAPFASLHHVALVTNDMRKTVAFYRDLLGGEKRLLRFFAEPVKAS